jgi:hypothetical protein
MRVLAGLEVRGSVASALRKREQGSMTTNKNLFHQTAGQTTIPTYKPYIIAAQVSNGTITLTEMNNYFTYIFD